MLIEVTIDYLQKFRNIHLTKDDFANAYKSNEWIKPKKWTQRLTEVLKFKSAFPQGKRIDDLVQKNAIFQEAMSRLCPLSKETVHQFLWDIVPTKISQMLESFHNTMPESGVIPPTRATTWVHPSNLADHLDHDL